MWENRVAPAGVNPAARLEAHCSRDERRRRTVESIKVDFVRRNTMSRLIKKLPIPLGRLLLCVWLVLSGIIQLETRDFLHVILGLIAIAAGVLLFLDL